MSSDTHCHDPDHANAAAATGRTISRRDAAGATADAESLTGYTLPISKLRSVPFQARVALKVRRITTCSQLLRAAAGRAEREALAQAARLSLDLLTELVQRADMARVNGVGTVFGLMLEELGIRDVAALAAQEPEVLHERLRRYNQEQRLARRSPTPEEVSDWIAQARRLRPLIKYADGEAELTAAE